MSNIKYAFIAILAFIPYAIWLLALPILFILLSRTSVRLWDNFTLYKIKRTIQETPSLGERDIDGTYHFKLGKFHLHYVVSKSSISAESGPEIKIISIKRKLSWPERQITHFKKRAENVWYYQQWLSLFKPGIFGLLILVGAFLYFGVIEPEGAKLERLRYLIAAATGLNTEQIQTLGGGWVRIFGKRTTYPDQYSENFFYDVNVFDWLTFNQDGYVVRYRGEPYGSAIHPVTWFDYSGKAILRKEGKDIEAVSGMQYTQPQGSGVRQEKIGSQNISVQGDLKIKDMPPSQRY